MNQHIQDKYPPGSRPRIHYIPYLIFVSYIVSFIGAFTTVELLHRRQSGNTWRSWVQLGACSVSFGLVAIWCMHFVGNRAIVLGDGENEIQLYYNATFTAVSAILPIVVIFLGLLAADRFYKNNKHTAIRHVALLICGICAGAAVTEMHYLGNKGTTNYHLDNDIKFIVGAASIAVVDCVIAFGLFFHWSGHWMDNIWRRLLVACFLAVAVSGMHWTAAAGTAYEITGYHTGSGQARNVNLIIATCLCLSACMVCFAMGFLKQVHKRKLRDRAEQVVLAVAMFDSDGKLLVTPAGLMPCQTITRQFHQRTFDEDFDIRHPVFQWLFRVSRNWSGTIDLIPSMREHLLHTGFLQPGTPVIGGANRVSIGAEEDSKSSYSAIFREMFCVSAQDIARSMEVRLQDLGHLYENVETTGTLLNARTLFLNAQGKPILAADIAGQTDLEAGLANPIIFGRGQMLVLTRKVGAFEASRLQNIGFRFASMEQIGDHLARSLQISRDDLDRLIGRLQTSCVRDALIPRKGTYLASFLLQPSPVLQGLDVIVQRLLPDRLPMVKLANDELTQREVKLLSTFNGCTLEDCLMRIDRHSGSVTGDDIFLDKFRNKIIELFQQVPEPALRQAYFSAQQLDIAHGVTGHNDPLQSTIFAFCGIKEIYNQTLQSPTLRCVPLSFLRANLRTYTGSPDHALLAHKTHKEFGSLHSTTMDPGSPTSRKSPKWTTLFRTSTVASSSSATVVTDSSSEKGLVNLAPSFDGMATAAVASHPFGGIMVSQDVVISEDREGKGGVDLELRDWGVRSVAGVADAEQVTMVDRLMGITTGFRDLQGSKLLGKDGRR
ncbi:hypothetical protein P280DRAFT_534249 [Massarina eburnea CBS 473.64]|uniref:MHYT domain-containing protein n=1 Tax=Massarina eburnea CBS 473.64 TaxID=1395130 RepID=A0A6A6RPN2_9PLEO|nr:hypothetical protein P280DRAFT_534249 [Massarina eburnea CBS 473.64]